MVMPYEMTCSRPDLLELIGFKEHSGSIEMQSEPGMIYPSYKLSSFFGIDDEVAAVPSRIWLDA